jgi:flagellar export protein FliJ
VKRFRFPLESVLGWRRAQLDAEENRLRGLAAARLRLEGEMAGIEHERAEAERNVRAAQAVPAAELWALSAWRQAARSRLAALALRLRECDAEAARQRERVAAADRRCRLLERLRERRLGEWEYGEARELETAASDAYLARWKAARAPVTAPPAAPPRSPGTPAPPAPVRTAPGPDRAAAPAAAAPIRAPRDSAR